MRYNLGRTKMPNLTLPAIIVVQYTNHALDEAAQDPHGTVELYSMIHTDKCRIVEVETNDAGDVRKLVLRMDYRDGLELNLVVAINDTIHDTLFVKTVWLDRKARDWRKPYVRVS